MQLGHRNVLRSPGRLALGCATILIRVRAPPQRRHSNRLTAGSFVALTSIPPRSEVIDSSPVVLLRSTTFTMRYSVAALLMIARQLSESSFASAWSGPVMVKVRPSSHHSAGHSYRAGVQRSAWLATFQQRGTKPPRSSRARENEQQSRRANPR